MGNFSRLPNSNAPLPSKDENNPWLEETECYDEIALLLSGLAKRCSECERSTRTYYLEDGLYPDCYQKNHQKPSPALKRHKENLESRCSYGASGEAD
jgi:hypothetical protein